MPFGVLKPNIFGLSVTLRSPASSFYRWLLESFSGNKGGRSLKLTIINLTKIRFKLYSLQAYSSKRCNFHYTNVKCIDVCYRPVNKLLDLERIRHGMLTRTLIKYLYDTSLQAIAQHI